MTLAKSSEERFAGLRFRGPTMVEWVVPRRDDGTSILVWVFWEQGAAHPLRVWFKMVEPIGAWTGGGCSLRITGGMDGYRLAHVRYDIQPGRGPGEVDLPREVLPSLVRAYAHWLTERGGWWAVEPSRIVRDEVHEVLAAPHEEGRVVETRSLPCAPKRLRGKEAPCALPSAVDLGEGARVVAELWRHGDRCGPPVGMRVGLRYDLGHGIVAEGRRDALEVLPGGVRLLPSHVALLDRVLPTLEAARARSLVVAQAS